MKDRGVRGKTKKSSLPENRNKKNHGQSNEARKCMEIRKSCDLTIKLGEFCSWWGVVQPQPFAHDFNPPPPALLSAGSRVIYGLIRLIFQLPQTLIHWTLNLQNLDLWMYLNLVPTYTAYLRSYDWILMSRKYGTASKDIKWYLKRHLWSPWSSDRIQDEQIRCERLSSDESKWRCCTSNWILPSLPK